MGIAIPPPLCWRERSGGQISAQPAPKMDTSPESPRLGGFVSFLVSFPVGRRGRHPIEGAIPPPPPLGEGLTSYAHQRHFSSVRTSRRVGLRGYGACEAAEGVVQKSGAKDESSRSGTLTFNGTHASERGAAARKSRVGSRIAGVRKFCRLDSHELS
jgi:hypothetical protein